MTGNTERAAGRIVVGLDGTAASLTTVRWAAQEAAADRDDLPIHDYRHRHLLGQHAQLRITGRHVVAVEEISRSRPAVGAGDRADAVPLEFPPVPVIIVRQPWTQASQHRLDQPRHSPSVAD